MFYTHILSKIMHSPNYIYTPNNSRSGPVSGDNSNKQIFILHIFRGNKQIDYRRVRQLSNLLVCRQGRKSAYYPPVTIVWFWWTPPTPILRRPFLQNLQDQSQTMERGPLSCPRHVHFQWRCSSPSWLPRSVGCSCRGVWQAWQGKQSTYFSLWK